MIKKIVYLEHSGFFLESEKAYFVFDYYRDPAKILEASICETKPVYFFVSHAHYDHWNKDMFKYAKNHSAYFILDESMKIHAGKYLEAEEVKNNCIFVSPKMHIGKEEPPFFANKEQAGLFDIITAESTDEGVAFLLSTGDELIYHAGDLNVWDWQDGYGFIMENIYESVLSGMKAEASVLTKKADLKYAFVPVDNRLGAKAASGAGIFAKIFKADFIIPMHRTEVRDMRKEIEAEWNARNVPEANRAKLIQLLEPGEEYLAEQALI